MARGKGQVLADTGIINDRSSIELYGVKSVCGVFLSLVLYCVGASYIVREVYHWGL